MEDAGAFTSIELNDAALASLMGMGDLLPHELLTPPQGGFL